jgi:hypothetical protein
VSVPIFDAVNGLTGSNGEYHIVGFAAFHITGYQLAGDTWPAGMSCPESPGASGRCFRGYFTETTTSGDGFGGPDMGVTVIRVVG